MVKFKAITNKLKHSKAVRKVLSVIVSASLAVSALAVNAFAAEGDATGGVDYSSMITTITNGFSTIITNCVTIATAVIPLGLGIMGLGKMWDVAKKFFTKATN